MAIMVFKATFAAFKKGGFHEEIIIKTITFDTCAAPSFNLQSDLDRLITEIEKEGFERISLRDVQNISTPIIRRKN